METSFRRRGYGSVRFVACVGLALGAMGCASGGTDGSVVERNGFMSLPDVDGGPVVTNPSPDAGTPVTPTVPTGPEACDNGLDDDGDGIADEGCACEPGTQPCYIGPAASAGVGPCTVGTQTCDGADEFARWGECIGSVLPAAEICGDSIDNDCNGVTDETCAPPEMPPEEMPDPEPEMRTPPMIVPAQCTPMTFTHVVGAASCGLNQAVYMMDDGDGPNFICCPLPAFDILSADPPATRVGQCAADEVITGAIGTNTFLCTRINGERYRLGAPQLPCYFGDGASGARGVTRCGAHPHSFTVLQDRAFGSDGCSGLPYGALFTKQTGDNCRDLGASQLLYTGAVAGDPTSGTPVPMFME